MREPSVGFGVRIRTDDLNSLEAIAIDRKVSRNKVLREAVRLFVESHGINGKSPAL